MDLCVAGLPIRVESADKDYFARRFAAYARDDGREPVMTMRVAREERIVPPAGEETACIHSIHILHTAEGRLCRYGTGKNGTVTFCVSATPDYSRVDITLSPLCEGKDFSLTRAEYMLTGFCFRNRLTVLGGGVLHSSAIAYRGDGIAFSAPSGTGKSTHAGLWQEAFGDDVQIINDDKPAIRFIDGIPTLFGTPWSGKTEQNENRSAPLKAIVFIERGKENRICRLDQMSAVFHLTEQISRPYYDEDLGEKTVDFAIALEQAVPIYQLQCNISREAALIAKSGILKEEIQ